MKSLLSQLFWQKVIYRMDVEERRPFFIATDRRIARFDLKVYNSVRSSGGDEARILGGARFRVKTRTINWSAETRDTRPLCTASLNLTYYLPAPLDVMTVPLTPVPRYFVSVRRRFSLLSAVSLKTHGSRTYGACSTGREEIGSRFHASPREPFKKRPRLKTATAFLSSNRLTAICSYFQAGENSCSEY